MISIVSKDKLHQVETFISDLITEQNKITEKITNCDFTLLDVFDYECIDYYITGMFSMLSVLRLNFRIDVSSKPSRVIIENYSQNVNYSDIKKRLEAVMESLRDVSINELKLDDDKSFDNEFIPNIKMFMFLYIMYGVKVVASFFNLNIDDRLGTSNLVTVDETNSLINDNVDTMRRLISNATDVAKKIIDGYQKIKITLTRIKIIEIRRSRLQVVQPVSDRSYKIKDEDEFKYYEQRINYFNTELSRFRNDVTIAEDELNNMLKDYFSKTLLQGYTNE